MDKREKKSLRQEHISTIVDTQTGEVVSVNTLQTFRVDKEPDFVKLYIEDLIKLKNLPSSTNSIMLQFLSFMRYDNTISIHSYEKKAIADKLQIKKVTVDMALTNLCKKSILIRVDKGTYLANPYLFGKGKWEDVRSIRMTIDYTSDGRAIVAERNAPTQLSIQEFDINVEKTFKDQVYKKF